MPGRRQLADTISGTHRTTVRRPTMNTTIRVCQSLHAARLPSSGTVATYWHIYSLKEPQVDTLSNQADRHLPLTRPTIVILEATITQRFWKQLLPGWQWWFCNQTNHSNLEGCKWSEHPLHIHPPDPCTYTYRCILECSLSGYVGVQRSL